MKKHLIFAAFAAILMGACDFAMENLFAPSTGVMADGVDFLCENGSSVMGMEARMATVAEINSKTETGYHTATDCTRDGLPDFAIDPSTGMPLPEAP